MSESEEELYECPGGHGWRMDHHGITCPTCAALGNPVKTKRGNKYGAVRTYSENIGRWFDSKAEARRGEELWLMQKAGEIEVLLFQVPFVLCQEPKITVTIDFVYLAHGRQVYEDCKGVLTRDSRTRYAWLKQKHGITVELTK